MKTIFILKYTEEVMRSQISLNPEMTVHASTPRNYSYVVITSRGFCVSEPL